MIALEMLRVLVVEDHPTDAELMIYELKRAGQPVEWTRVDTEDAYLALLKTQPDVILSDYSLPSFGAVRAIQLLRQTELDIPLIVVTGSVSEELAVACIKEGAADYLLKDRMVRLHPAIMQVLHEKQLRDAKRAAEIALRASEERYRQAFENTQAMKLLLDPTTGVIIDANSAACKFYGYPLQELTTRTIADVTTLTTDLTGILSTRTPYFMFQQRLSSGETREVEVYASTIEVQGQTLLYWILHDITERKRMEAALLAAELLQAEIAKERELLTLKDRFLAMVSHEFRTPLSVILSSTQLLTRYQHRISAERQLEHIQQIEGQVLYMTELINDVLTLSQIRAGKLPFVPAPFNVERFCRQLFEELQLVDNHQHLFSFRCVGQLEHVYMDEKLLRHIFVNLLSNAIKYTPAGKTVSLELSREGEMGIFRISDEGIGIPPADQKRLFEPFHRAGNTGTIEGTGLGLAIVHGNVEAHQGTITCHSQEGLGTTFEVRLPLNVSPDAIA